VTIVVGLVPGPEGEAALARGCEEARLRGARLIVVNANRGDRAIDTSIVSDRDRARAEAVLDAAGVTYEFRQPVDPEPIATTLLGVAEAEGADLIVIGVRRRSPVGKLLLGSTASQILLGASCPVLAVKA
jgi:nucleotide-binding universal stress UspA family protein